MKKYLLLIICFYSFAARGQFYVKAFTGYAFATNPIKNESVAIVNNVENVYLYKFKYGQGLNLGISMGYQINKQWGVELTANTQLITGNSYHITMNNDTTLLVYNYSYNGFFGDLKYSSSILQFTPQVTYTFDLKKNSLYFKIGPNFLMNKSYYSTTTYPGRFYSNTEHLEQYSKGDISVGLQCNFGIQHHLSENTMIYAEFVSVNTRYKFTKSGTTAYTIDGVDHLSDFGTQNYNDDTRVDFSNVGLNVGVQYYFHKKGKHS